MTSADDALLDLADDLYGGSVAAFTAARDAAAKASSDKTFAARVKALRKPSLAAWAVNLLVRREAEQIDQVLELAVSLRAAAESLDGDGLRTLTRQRRQLIAALTTAAGRHAREQGVKLTPAVADQVEGMLTAAMIDPVAADVVRSGLVTTAFTSTGVSDLDPSTVCAVPEAVGHRAPAVTEEEQESPVLHVVPDDGIRLEAARERLEEAVLALAEAREEHEHVSARGERLQARRLQLQGEIDELRRRLAGIEEDVDNLDDEIDEVDEAIEEAAGLVEAAEQDVTEARAEVDRLS